MPDGHTPARIGHNRPPAFDQAVADECQEILSRLLADLRDRPAPVEIASTAQAEQVNDRVQTAKAAVKRVEDARKTEKQPHLDASRAVDGTFGALRERIEADVITPLAAPLNAWATAQGPGCRIGSASGLARAVGARTVHHAEITNAAAAARRFRNHPDLIACLEKLALAEMRHADDKTAVTIPGVTFHTDIKVA